MLSRPKIQPETNLKTNRVQKLQRILYWTPYFMAEDWQFGLGSKPFRKCPQPNCAGNHFYFYNHCNESWENLATKRNQRNKVEQARVRKYSDKNDIGDAAQQVSW